MKKQFILFLILIIFLFNSLNYFSFGDENIENKEFSHDIDFSKNNKNSFPEFKKILSILKYVDNYLQSKDLNNSSYYYFISGCSNNNMQIYCYKKNEFNLYQYVLSDIDENTGYNYLNFSSDDIKNHNDNTRLYANSRQIYRIDFNENTWKLTYQTSYYSFRIFSYLADTFKYRTGSLLYCSPNIDTNYILNDNVFFTLSYKKSVEDEIAFRNKALQVVRSNTTNLNKFMYKVPTNGNVYSDYYYYIVYTYYDLSNSELFDMLKNNINYSLFASTDSSYDTVFRKVSKNNFGINFYIENDITDFSNEIINNENAKLIYKDINTPFFTNDDTTDDDDTLIDDTSSNVDDYNPNDNYGGTSGHFGDNTTDNDGFFSSLINSIKSIFIPDEEFFTDFFNQFKSEFDRILNFGEVETVLDNINSLNFSSTEQIPDLTIHLPDSYGGGTFNIFDFNFFNQYKNQVHTFVSTILWISFIFHLYRRLPIIIRGS